MAEKIPSWIERLLLPQLSEIKGELKAVNGRLDALKGEMQGEFKAINTRIDSLATEVKDLRESINMAQRLATLEAQVKELSSRSK